MIELGYSNVLLAQLLTEKVKDPSPTEQIISEFDGVTLKVHTRENRLIVSMAMRCYDTLNEYGAAAIMEREYPGMTTDTEPGYDVSLLIPTDCSPDLIAKLALIKRNALAAPFERAFEEHERLVDTQETGALMTIQYRDEEAIYILPSNDRVTVIFSTIFREETDRIFAKVFLQEFYDARKRPAVQNAPQVLFSIRDPPMEIRGRGGLVDDKVGYVTFVLFPRHFQGHRRDECISHIQMFRNTLHFHIKASKAYMHQRSESTLWGLY